MTTSENDLSALALARISSDIVDADQALAVVDGAINLLSKAGMAIERGGPGDRARAYALIERAERHLNDQSAEVQDRGGMAEAREAIARLRVLAEDLTE